MTGKKKILLLMEGVLAVAYFAMPELYYNPLEKNFFDRFYADSLIICGFLWGVLVFLTIKDGKFSEKTNHILTGAAGLLIPFACFLWLEFYNDMQFWVPVFEIPKKYLFLDLLIYYVIFALFLLVFNSIRSAGIGMVTVTACFGFLNYQLTVFRSMAFIASDLYSLRTAVSVAGTYKPEIDVDTAEFFLLALVMLALVLKLDREKLFHRKGRLAWLAACCLLFAGFVNVYVTSDYLEKIGVDFRVYRPQYKYRYYGTLLTTMRTFGYLHVTEPEGYSREVVEKIAKTYQYKAGSSDTRAEKKPNIVIVMNESFADLKAVGNLDVSEDYMPYFHQLKKNTIKGYTYASVFGGNTANSEFECLTGNTLAFLPDNSVPYQLFLREKTAGLTDTLKKQGYGSCLALHPFYETGYSRYKVYPLMGFDRFYTSDDFPLFVDTVNYHITDSENYKKLIRLYENRQDKNKPFYLFNVTMQNHGSYDGSTAQTGNQVRLEGNLKGYGTAEEYLNMIKMSDRALKELIRYFKKVKDPTVILFFGDHQPDLEESFYDSLLGTDVKDLEGEELEKLYKVPFCIWANYDIEEKYVEKTSNNYLSVLLADVAGIQKTGYQNFLSSLREKIPCINAIGYWGEDGKFYKTDDKKSPYYPLIHQYDLLEYNNLFGKEKQIKDFFFLR
ncbi:MAG: LTA synthase family protein [Eubacterium sp.]|nr:LTA synthase family protein [Eubacterium sp.]